LSSQIAPALVNLGPENFRFISMGKSVNPGQWKAGQSGNPKGRPRGQLNRRAMAKVAELQVKGMPPDAMGMAIVKSMAEIALDPREPKQLRIQASSCRIACRVCR
jgi:hypothetical protein